jgi:hypothetical protein
MPEEQVHVCQQIERGRLTTEFREVLDSGKRLQAVLSTQSATYSQFHCAERFASLGLSASHLTVKTCSLIMFTPAGHTSHCEGSGRLPILLRSSPISTFFRFPGKMLSSVAQDSSSASIGTFLLTKYSWVEISPTSDW